MNKQALKPPKDSVDYIWAFDTVANAITDMDWLDARNLNEVVEGIKKDPETFIHELLNLLQEEVTDRVEKQGLCPDCLAEPEKGSYEEKVDGWPVNYVQMYCPECEREL